MGSAAIPWTPRPLIWLGALDFSRKEMTVTRGSFNCPVKRKTSRQSRTTIFRANCFQDVIDHPCLELSASETIFPGQPFDNIQTTLRNSEVANLRQTSNMVSDLTNGLVIADLDPGSAKLAIGIVGPFLSALSFLFILRIVMSWYPKLPVGKFPYVIAYAPTEPLLVLTRKLIPPLGGVDVTPVVWFALVSFLNEILVGPQGILVLLSQQV